MLTYDRGSLEIMSPLLEHEDDGRFLGRLAVVMTEELDLPITSGRSTTLRRQLRQRGVEADECFWIANASRLRGRRRLDLRRDPPPDLAIEVDVTRSSLDRLAIYAVLLVPEVWPLENDRLLFHVLGANGAYAVAERSLAFPLVTATVLMRFLKLARRAVDENPVIREFRTWLLQNRDSVPPRS
jgi:Uma2 family endonuclease